MKFYIVLCFLLVLIGCKIAEELTLKREEFTSDMLRLDGYFYTKYQSGYSVFFLYRNGVFRSGGAVLEIDNLSELDIFLKKRGDNVVDLHYSYGVYQVDEDEIMINRWMSGSGGPYPSRVFKGDIIDSLHIIMTDFSGTTPTNRTDTFRFRQFSPKPDSTAHFLE